MAWKYPPEVAAFIREHASEGSIQEMVERANSEFGTSFTYAKMKSYFARHKLHAAPRKGRERPGLRITTPEMDAFIRSHVRGVGPGEMASLVNGAFGTGFTKGQMKGYYNRNRLDSGLTGRFKPGQVPANKGKSWDEFMSPEGQARSRMTAFKPGHEPYGGRMPVGTVRLRQAVKGKPGSKPYYVQKTAQPNTWRLKHIVEWEEHNGPVPEGCMVAFADGDTLNWHIGNLVLETKAQHAVKTVGGYTGSIRRALRPQT